MELHWGWLIVIYLFLGGLGAGAYLTSYAAGKGWLGNSPGLHRVGYFISGPIVAFGTLLLVFDLGQGLRKPWLLIGLIMNPRSVMTWGVYILATFILVALAVAYFAYKKKEAPKILMNFGAFLALATGAYTGLLIAVVKAIPFWNSYLMPILFVVSALSTGLSITVLMSHILEKHLKTDEQRVTKTHLGLVGTEIVLLALLLGMMLSGSNGAVAVTSASMLISGSLAISFWAILVGLGLVAPLLVSVYGLKKLAPAQGGWGFQPDLVPAVSEGAAALEGEQQGVTNLLLISDAAVVLGGFVLRYVVIFAALPLWNGILN